MYKKHRSNSLFYSFVAAVALLVVAVMAKPGSNDVLLGQLLPSAPKSPTNLQVQMTPTTQGTFWLTWTWNDNSTDEKGFYLTKTDGGNPSVVTSANMTAYRQQVTIPTTTTTYTFYVEAFNSAGRSSVYSSPVVASYTYVVKSSSSSSSTSSIPKSPSNFRAQIMPSTPQENTFWILWTWSDNSTNEQGFYLSDTHGGSPRAFTTAGVTSYRQQYPKPVTTTKYSYYLDAYNNYGRSSKISSPVFASVTYTAPKDPLTTLDTSKDGKLDIKEYVTARQTVRKLTNTSTNLQYDMDNNGMIHLNDELIIMKFAEQMIMVPYWGFEYLDRNFDVNVTVCETAAFKKRVMTAMQTNDLNVDVNRDGRVSATDLLAGINVAIQLVPNEQLRAYDLLDTNKDSTLAEVENQQFTNNFLTAISAQNLAYDVNADGKVTAQDAAIAANVYNICK